MPKEMTISYVMSGPVTQDIYSEKEMADALEISVQELRATLDPTEYGPRKERLGYSFHIHPRANGGVNSEFLFSRTSYTHNLQVFNLRKWLQGRDEWDDIAFNYVISVHDHYKHDKITEEIFLRGLAEYRQRFLAKDMEFHYSIKDYWQFNPFYPMPEDTAGDYEMFWFQHEKHPWSETRKDGTTRYATLDEMIAAARILSPLFCANLSAPGYTVGDVMRNPYGRRSLSWRKRIPCPEGRTWCEECGGTEIENGRCSICGGDDMIRTAYYTWEEHKEVL